MNRLDRSRHRRRPTTDHRTTAALPRPAGVELTLLGTVNRRSPR